MLLYTWLMLSGEGEKATAVAYCGAYIWGKICALSIYLCCCYLSIYEQHSVVDRCWGLKHCASNRGLLLEIRVEGEESERGDMLYYLRSILLFCSTFQKEKEEGGA